MPQKSEVELSETHNSIQGGASSTTTTTPQDQDQTADSMDKTDVHPDCEKPPDLIASSSSSSSGHAHHKTPQVAPANDLHRIIPLPSPLPPLPPPHQPSQPGAYAQRSLRHPGAPPSPPVPVVDQAGGSPSIPPTVEEGLVVARPVIAEDTTRFFAEPVHPKDQQRRRLRKEAAPTTTTRCGLFTVGFLFLCGMGVITTTIVIVIVVGQKTSPSSSASVETTNTANSTVPEQQATTPSAFLFTVPISLPEDTMNIIRKDHEKQLTPIHTTTLLSPQYRAYRWVQEDPAHYYSPERLLQRFVLATVFYATHGETSWTHLGGDIATLKYVNTSPAASITQEEEASPPVTTTTTPAFINITSEAWLSYEGTGECAWFSTALLSDEETCRNLTYYYYTYLDVAFNNLEGTLPPEIGLLSDTLEGLRLHKNQLRGSIPTDVGSLSRLRHLSYSKTLVSGSLPTELGLLNQLEYFSSLDAQLTGTFPTELLQLSKLQQLKLGHNANLYGTLPPGLGHAMSSLKLFMVGQNNLEGSLPSSLSAATDLIALDVSHNTFSGTLPSELANLKQLVQLNLEHNPNLTGPFPSELGLLNATLGVLKLKGTAITGRIPEELCVIGLLSFDCSPSLCGCDCPCPTY